MSERDAGPSQVARPPLGGGREATSGAGSFSDAGPSQVARPPLGGGRDATSGRSPESKWTRWLWISLIVVALDVLTKQAILATFKPGEEKVILPFFSLVLAFNPGAAFSFLADADGWQRWFFSAIAIVASVVIVWLLRRGGSHWYCVALALILGGALGNVWDRLTTGLVVDFLLFHWRGWAYPAFNVADSAITIGAVLLIADSFRARRHDAPPSAIPKER